MSQQKGPSLLGETVDPKSIPGLRQGKHRMSLEYLRVPISKEMLKRKKEEKKKKQELLKRTQKSNVNVFPLTKAGQPTKE